MKLIQLNAWGGKLQYQIPQFLNNEKPEIVCLQEIHDLKGRSGALFVTLDELKEKLGIDYSAMAPVYSFGYMNRQLDYGNAVLSQLPIESQAVVFTQGQYKTSFDVLVDSDVRNFQHVEILHNGKSLHIINHHGAFIKGSKTGNSETERQMDLICTYIEKLRGPLIIAGDFNLTPDSKSLVKLNNRLHNLSVEHNLVSTYNSLNSHRVVCDYIFVNDEIIVNDFHAADDLVSDHRALVLDFDI